MIENTLHAKATMTVVVDGNPSAVNKSTNTRDINRLVMPTVFILLMASLPYSTNGSSIFSAEAQNSTTTTGDDQNADGAISSFRMSGGIGSLATDLLNVTIRENLTDETPIYVLVGNWSMDVINGEVNYFQVDFIMSLQDGTQMHVYSVNNLRNIVIPSSPAEEEGSSPVEGFPSNLVISPASNYSLSLSGYVDVLTNDTVKWENVPLSIDIFNGNTISILLYPSETDNQFKGQPIYGVVAWILDANDKPIKPSIWAIT
jgi:hypothetical protein